MPQCHMRVHIWIHFWPYLGHVWPYIAICTSAWPYTWPRMAILGHSWPCASTCAHACTLVHTCAHVGAHGRAWPFLVIYGHVYGHTWTCLSMYGHVWIRMDHYTSQKRASTQDTRVSRTCQNKGLQAQLDLQSMRLPKSGKVCTMWSYI